MSLFHGWAHDKKLWRVEKGTPTQEAENFNLHFTCFLSQPSRSQHWAAQTITRIGIDRAWYKSLLSLSTCCGVTERGSPSKGFSEFSLMLYSGPSLGLIFPNYWNYMYSNDLWSYSVWKSVGCFQYFHFHYLVPSRELPTCLVKILEIIAWEVLFIDIFVLWNWGCRVHGKNKYLHFKKFTGARTM